MIVCSAVVTLYIPDAQSLKDKRRIAKSLIDTVRHKFNAAIAQVGTQDVHRTLTLGVAVVSADKAHACAMLDAIIRFIELNEYAQMIDVERDCI